MAGIFRQKALDKLSSPDQLDRMIIITPPSAYVGLVGAFIIVVALLIWGIFGKLPESQSVNGVYISSEGVFSVCTDTSGIVSEVMIHIGDKLEEGDAIAVIEVSSFDGTSKEERVMTSSVSGKVTNVNIVEGSFVTEGSTMAKVMQGDDFTDRKILCYVPVTEGKRIETGMRVMVYPTTINRQEYGHMEATVSNVSDYLVSSAEMINTLGSEELAQSFLEAGPVVLVECELLKDASSVSGYYWSNKKGREVEITDGTIVSGDVVISENSPISKIIPYVKEKLTGEKEH